MLLFTSYCSCLLLLTNASTFPMYALQEKPLGNALERKVKLIYLRVVKYVYKSSPYGIWMSILKVTLSQGRAFLFLWKPFSLGFH